MSANIQPRIARDKRLDLLLSYSRERASPGHRL